MSGFADEETITAFAVESREMLDDVDPRLVEMAQRAGRGESVDAETINAIFRLFHSMKGNAGFLGFGNVSSVTHEAETLLDIFRKEKAEVGAGHIRLLIEAGDLMREILGGIEENLNDRGFEERAAGISARFVEAVRELRGGGPKNEGNLVQQISPLRIVAAGSGAETFPDLSELITPEMKEKFVEEADDLLEKAEAAVLNVRGGEEAGDFIADAFRCIHSFKGNCGFLGYVDLQNLSHAVEAVLDAVRNGSAPVDDTMLEILLQVTDVLRDKVAEIGAGKSDKIDGIAAMLSLVGEFLPAEKRSVPVGSEDPEQSLFATGVAAASGDAAAEACPCILVIDDEEPIRDVMNIFLRKNGYAVTAVSSAEEALDILEHDDKYALVVTDIRMGGMSGLEFVKVLRAKKKDLPVIVLTAYTDKATLVEILDIGKVDFLRKPVDCEKLLEKVRSVLSREAGRRGSVVAGDRERGKRIERRDIRVDLHKLDLLVNLVGELVIAEAMVTGNPDVAGRELENFEKAGHHLRRIVRDLQDVTMSVRMIPIAATFRKMIRLVHDLSAKAGKQVELDLSGEETEVDKTVAEAIADPLVHIVRNAIDHGIETPDERKAAGKPKAGKLSIGARHEGGEVWITIFEDGRGLSREKILKKAAEKGLVEGTGAELRDDDVYRLIFEPGFSTAATVTDISGRGVGMDVVKKNVEKLKGRVDVRTQPGKGTVFTLRIPLTLAVIEGMLVRVGGAKYTIPMLAMRESFRPEQKDLTVTPDGQELVNVRGRLYPIIRLHELHAVAPDNVELDRGLLVSFDYRDDTYCLFVDEVLGQNQTVIKGLSGYVGNVRGVSGCTILGDGQVSLILDVGALIEKAMDRGIRAQANEKNV